MKNDGAVLAQTTFMCLLCGDVTGDVRLVQDDGYARLYRGSASYPVASDRFGAHVRALHDNDLRALFALNFEYTPCYCPKCDANFCAKHWRIWQEFEDDGWADCVRGTCPNGHARMLED